jgi:hypothetical protein
MGFLPHDLSHNMVILLAGYSVLINIGVDKHQVLRELFCKIPLIQPFPLVGMITGVEPCPIIELFIGAHYIFVSLRKTVKSGDTWQSKTTDRKWIMVASIQLARRLSSSLARGHNGNDLDLLNF